MGDPYPELYFFDRSNSNSPEILTSPTGWMEWTDLNGQITVFGDTQPVSNEPFNAIDDFFDQYTSGYIAGWIAYDLVYNLFNIEPPDSDLNHFPPLVLAHYDTSKQTVSIDSDTDRLSVNNFDPTITKNQFANRIRQIKQLIRRGYVYQINFSQRFRSSKSGSIRSLIPRLNQASLPPQSVYFRYGHHEGVSFSPERFIRIQDDRIITQPIKGTRRLKENPDEDKQIRRNLRNSSKDRAEHMMIVDLERNDLNRICTLNSVRASQLCDLYTFQTVHHLISTIEGTVRSTVTPGHLFNEIFPGGSITGAPKPITVRMIHHLEQRRRGLYTGTIGYWNLDSNTADWNIVIRTLLSDENYAWWDAGGGIVIDSQPMSEYNESLDKTRWIEKILEWTKLPASI